MRDLILLLGLLAALLPPLETQAADGHALVGFGTDAEFPGYGFYPGPYAGSTMDQVIASAATPEGRLFAFADVQAGPGAYRALVYRLEADGFPDFTFDTFGYKTLVPPCAAGRLVDAVVDGQGRPWLLFSGCGDFEIYRLTPDGAPDTSLLGSGRLTIPFNLGGNNQDFPAKLAVTPAGGIAVAGPVDSPTGRRLGIANFTAEGGPVPGFGNAGRVDFDFAWSVTRVGGVHPMADGRIVATADTQFNPGAITHVAVRVQPSGAGDLGFGNAGPGVSELDLRSATGSSGFSPTTRQSHLDRNGAIVQVGSWNPNNDPAIESEMLFLRWRPDGQPDTSVGPFGHRLYGLNRGGDPGDTSRNTEIAFAVARQGDGKYLLAGYSRNAQGQTELALLRLRRNLQPDPGFGSNGWVTDRLGLGPNGTFNMQPSHLLLRPGHFLTSLQVLGNSGYVATLRGSENDLLFADTFD